MFGELSAIADEIERGLRDHLSGLVGRDRVRGVNLEVDRYWWEWVTSLDGGWHKVGGKIYLHDSLIIPQRWRWHRNEWISQWRDPKFRPPDWDAHCKAMGFPGNSLPVIIRVILTSSPSSQDLNREPTYGGYPIVYETRKAIRAQSGAWLSDTLSWLTGRTHSSSSTSLSVGRNAPRTAGTLGGLLRGVRDERLYLVSCAHVLGELGTESFSPGPHEGRGGKCIGTVMYSSFPHPTIPGQACNPEAHVDAARLDVSVAEANENFDRSGVVGAHHIRPVRDMDTFDIVFLDGKESHRVDARLEALGLWHNVEFPDPYGTRCMGRLLQITKQFADQKPPITREGDSGAWIISSCGGVRCWDGMLIGSNGNQSYACFAEYVLDAANRAIPGGVALPS